MKKRNIKFALVLSEGVAVRSIEDLRVNFHEEHLIDYYKNGLLEKWLKQRNYEEEFNMLQEMNTINNISDSTLKENLYSIFKVEYEKEKSFFSKVKGSFDKLCL